MSYIIFYKAISVLFPTLILPFLMLGKYASKMKWILTRRAKLVNRPKYKPAQSLALKSEAAKNSKVILKILKKFGF